MEKTINQLSLLSSEEIINELNSNKKSDFINKLVKLKKLTKEMHKQLLDIFQKIKIKNDEIGNNILFEIISNQKISKMLKAFPSKELTDLFNFIKKYKKKTEKNEQKDLDIKKEEKLESSNDKKIEKKDIINYKNIDISLANLLNQDIPFEMMDINKIPDKFEDINYFIDYYFKKEYMENYKSIIDIYNIMNQEENNNNNNSDIIFYKDILITNLEVRCYGIFLSIEFEKIKDIENKFKEENLLIISSLDSSYIFITEIYLNPYNTRYYSQLKYFTPPLKENYQKIKVKLLNVEVLKKLCLITNEIKFQMFEYENQLSLSKISLKTLQNLDIKKFPIKENFEKIFSFEKEEINIDKIIEQIKSILLDERKINNIFLKNNIIINNENKLKFAPFIMRILNNIDSPLLIVSKNNLSIDRILLHISKNTKKLKIKKIIGHFNRLLRGINYFNYHCVGYENKELEDKIKHNWHYLKKSLSENRVNSKTIKYCQTIYNSIIDDFYEISGIKRNDKNNIKNQIIECFLNEKNLKGFIQSQVRNNPEEYLTKFSTFSNTIGKDYKIKYLWERTESYYTISTNEWKNNNIEYWYEQIGIEYNEEGEYDDDFLFENENEEEENNEIDYENNK